jgi:hypothetical protein
MASQGLPLGRAVVGPANAVGEYGDGTVEGIADAPGVQFRGGRQRAAPTRRIGSAVDGGPIRELPDARQG